MPLSRKLIELHLAATQGNLETVKKLYSDEQVDINEVNVNTGKAALHWAAQNAHSKIVAFLLSVNAMIDCKDNLGNTPLNYACQQDSNITNRITTIESLLADNANPLIANNAGMTAFMHMSIIRGNFSVTSTPHLQNAVRKLIQTIKSFVAREALQRGTAAQLKPNGKVIFNTPMELLANLTVSDAPLSGQFNINLIDTRSTSIRSSLIKLAPHH